MFQGLSHRVTIPDIWKFEKGIFNASVAPRKFCYNFIAWEQQNNFLGPRPCFVKNLNYTSWGHGGRASLVAQVSRDWILCPCPGSHSG